MVQVAAYCFACFALNREREDETARDAAEKEKENEKRERQRQREERGTRDAGLYFMCEDGKKCTGKKDGWTDGWNEAARGGEG